MSRSAVSSGCSEEDVAGKMLQFHPLVEDSGNPLVPIPLQQLIKFLPKAEEKVMFKVFWLEQRNKKH